MARLLSLRRPGATAALALFALSFLASAASARVPDYGLVVAKNLDDLISLDPAEVFEFSGGELAAQVYDRLVVRDPADPARLMPGAAEDWRFEGDRLVFRLRTGLVFQSGNPVRAADAAFSLRRAVRLGLAPAFILDQLGWNPANVEALVRAPDDRTLELDLAPGLAPDFVLNCLSAGIAAIVDEKTVMAHAAGDDFGHGWLRANGAGSGPFSLALWKPGQSVALEAFPAYRGGAPALRRVVFRHVREAATQRLLLERGDVDIARNLNGDQLRGLEADPETAETIRVARFPRADLLYLALNQKDPRLSRPEVREALRWLVDYRGIATTLLAGRARVHQAFWPGGFDGALEETPFSFDPARARALLARAGLGDGFAIRLDTPNSSPQIEIATALQANLAAGGIRLDIVPADQKQVITRYRARQHQAALLYWAPDYLDPHANAAAFARNPDNADDARDRTLAWRNGWNVPDLGRMVDQALFERDGGRRRALYLELQRRVQADGPFVIMFQAEEEVAMRREIEGFVLGPSFDLVSYATVTRRRP